MNIYDNKVNSPDEFIAECSVKDSDASFGGTANAMPGYSIADQRKPVLSEGSAVDGTLDVDMFSTSPVKKLRM
jgi:hypothetical protein